MDRAVSDEDFQVSVNQEIFISDHDNDFLQLSTHKIRSYREHSI